MVRHFFIAPIKEGSSQEAIDKEVEILASMRDNCKTVQDLRVNVATGWLGWKDTIFMTVDFKDKEDFEAYLKDPYHMDFVDKTGNDIFDRSKFIIAQIEC